MNESQFSSNVRNNLSRFGHVQPIETTTGNGVPDINFAAYGREGWLELKVAKNDLLIFQKGQLPWMLRRTQAGGTVSVLWLGRNDSVNLIYASILLGSPRSPFGSRWTSVQVADLTAYSSWEKRKVDWEAIACASVRVKMP